VLASGEKLLAARKTHLEAKLLETEPVRQDTVAFSDEHVFCTAPATENAPLQILFKCPTPAIVFGNATKPSRFAHF